MAKPTTFSNTPEIKSQFRKNIWKAVSIFILIAGVILLAFGAYDWWTGSDTAPIALEVTEKKPTLIQGWPATIALGIILLFSFMLGRRALGSADSFDLQERDKTRQTRMNMALWAVLALSAVSFSTTLFGLAEFLSPKDGGGSELFAWFVSGGTTLGIQGLMLIMSLILGEQIMQLRPLASDMIHDSVERQSRRDKNVIEDIILWLSNTDTWRMLGGLGMAYLSYLIYQNGSIEVPYLGKFLEFGRGLSLPLIILCLASLYFLVKAGTLGRSWNTAIILFLSFVYFGALAVSSLFSFDAYYRYLQSEDKQATSNRTVLESETNRLIAIAGNHYDDYIASQKEALNQDADFIALNSSITNLISGSKQYSQHIRDELDKTQSDLEAQRRKVKQARALEQQELSNLQQKKGAAELKVQENERLKKQYKEDLKRQHSSVQPVRDELAQLQTALEEKKRERAKEETGVDGRQSGKGPKWRVLNKEVEAQEKYIAQIQTDLNGKERLVANTRQKLNNIERDLQIAKGDVSQTSSQLVSFEPAQGTTMPSTMSAGLSSLENQRQQISSLNVDQVSTSLKRFTDSYSERDYQTYLDQCGNIKNILLKVTQDASGQADKSITDFECKPSTFELKAKKLINLVQKRASYEERCIKALVDGKSPSANTSTTTAKVEAPKTDGAAESSTTSQGASDPLVGLVAKEQTQIQNRLLDTKSCLNIMNAPTQEQEDFSAKIVQLEEEYSTGGHDIRRSINNLQRGEKFAVGAGAGAVFIDMLILVVGIILAMLTVSRFHDDPHNPRADQLELDLVNAARVSDPDHDPNKGIQTFFSYIQTNSDSSSAMKDSFFSQQIDIAKVANEDRYLVEHLLNVAAKMVRRKARNDGGTEPIFEINRSLTMVLSDILAMHTYNKADEPENSRRERKKKRKGVHNTMDPYASLRFDDDTLTTRDPLYVGPQSTGPKAEEAKPKETQSDPNAPPVDRGR